MMTDAWRSKGDWLSFRDQRLFVTSIGSGPAILVLHGFPTASYDFSRLAPLLAQCYRLVLLDYPGFGFSDKPRAYPYSLIRYMFERWEHQESWLAALQRHRAPLRLIWGQADPVAPPAVVDCSRGWDTSP